MSDDSSSDPLSAAQQEQILDLFGEIALKSAGSMVAPIFWSIADPLHGERMQNGSLFFLDTGHSVFGVTAAHVVRSYLEEVESPSFRHCMIARNGEKPYSIDLRDRIIGLHDEIDIATLRFSRAEINEIGTTILVADQNNWPPPLACSDSIVTYGGWPGVGRAWLEPKELKFGLVVQQGRVSSARETCISIQLERASIKQILGETPMPASFDFGGMSGGPALNLRQISTPSWIPSWTLEGVIFSGPNPSDDPKQSIAGFELFSIRPAHFIKADGTLDVPRWDSNRAW